MRNHGEVMPPEEVALWQVAKKTARDTPKQRNSTDCGILQMMSVNYETDCPRFRQKIALNLMRNRLD